MTPAEQIVFKVLENYAALYYATCLESPDAFAKRERMVRDAAAMIRPEIEQIENEAVDYATRRTQ